MKTQFDQRKVFITGGSSGIGKCLARDFLKLGAYVTIVADDPEKLETTRKELACISSAVDAMVCDIADMDQVQHTVADYLARFGAPDILINNAGYAVYRTFDEMTTQEITRLLTVNFIGACAITSGFLPSMIERKSGNIVVMASIAGCVAMTPCGCYSAAKHGLIAWARTLRAELHRFHIRVHVMCPGRVETDFFLHETFVHRLPRHEAKWTIPVGTVSQATIAAISRNSFLAYVPKWFGPLVWLKNLLPLASDPILQRLMRARVESVQMQRQNRVGSEHVS